MPKQKTLSRGGQALLFPEERMKCAISLMGHAAMGFPIPHKKDERGAFKQSAQRKFPTSTTSQEGQLHLLVSSDLIHQNSTLTFFLSNELPPQTFQMLSPIVIILPFNFILKVD